MSHTNQMQVKLKQLHPGQQRVKDSPAKRKIIRAGRRWGKTTMAATVAVEKFLDGRRVLYAVRTQEQVRKFWLECNLALEEPISAKVFYKNETRHVIELRGTEQGIRAKTAWNEDTLRGDYADFLILDEYQLMEEGAWTLVGAPMLLDNNGDALFIYTPVRGKSHARDLYEQAQTDETGRWEVFTGWSGENPTLSSLALDELTGDMSSVGYKMEILAEESGDDERALWNRQMLAGGRVWKHPDLDRIVVGVDPSGSSQGAECGIVVAGIERSGKGGLGTVGYVIGDYSLKGSPAEWGEEVVAAYHKHKADRVVGESNFGGEMVEHTIRSIDDGIAYKPVRASRGKVVRAEPVVALYEKNRIHHVGKYAALEDEQCSWVPGEKNLPSPNRIDALVFSLSEMMLDYKEYPPPGFVKYA